MTNEAVNWEMWSAIGTVGATVVALCLALRDSWRLRRDRKAQGNLWGNVFAMQYRDRLGPALERWIEEADRLERHEGHPDRYARIAIELEDAAKWPSHEDLSRLLVPLPAAAEHFAVARNVIEEASRTCARAAGEQANPDHRRFLMEQVRESLKSARLHGEWGFDACR
ncbi:hypothetical protein [Luteibacter yeojuensis]|nr:hypothetical protein [Luteibacter yeojuensis]